MITGLKKLKRGWRAFSGEEGTCGEMRVRDLRKTANDPRQLTYLSDDFVLADVPVAVGRRNGFPMGAGIDPFELAVKRALGVPDPESVITEVLQMYYSLVTPENASEWMGIEANGAPELAKSPPWGKVYPWQEVSISDRIEGARKWVRKQNKREGLTGTVAEGYPHFGPVSEAKLKIEVKRILRLFRAIQDCGYVRSNAHDGDILGTVLVGESDDWRWIAETGQHRAAAAAGLGFEKIPVRFHRAVYRVDVSAWPNLSSGVFTEGAAGRVFDNLFDGVIPDVQNPWLAWVDKLHKT